MGRIEKGMCPYNRGNPSILLILIQTVSFQAIKTATANPVEALRYE